MAEKEEATKRRSKRLFLVVIPRDGMLELIYRGQDRLKASEAVEKSLTRSEAKGDKGSVQVLKVTGVHTFMREDLQLRLTEGL